MAPEAETNNWLSFSLSPMEMLASNSHHHHQSPHVASSHPYFLDTFYSNDWGNSKAQGIYTDYVVDQQMGNPTTVPKLEDFFGGGNNTASYNSQTETTTQDSSSQLTHLYDPNSGANYFTDQPLQHQQDLKMMTSNGFQAAAFSTNSGSEVDDSASVVDRTTATQLGCGGAEFVAQSIESSQTELGGFTSTQSVTRGNLSLGVVPHDSDNNKAIVSVGVDSNNGVKKIADTFGQRTSIYRGVTRHRWTGRYEAHLWDNSCRKEGQARKGRQVYLGGYDNEEKAARSYDLAALKYWGPTATTNFPISSYTQELEEMKNATKQEFIASLRRKSSGFSRGASRYRGVTRHHQQGRWQARIGRVAGNKDLYLGTFATEEEAAEAYDIAAIKFRGVNAVTNFEMNHYDVETILKSNLPIGGAAKRLKLASELSDQKPTLSLDRQSQSSHASTGTSNAINFASMPRVPPMPFDITNAFFHQNLLHHLSSNGGSQAVSSEPFGSSASVVAPIALMPPAPAEFYIWPHHQSY